MDRSLDEILADGRQVCFDSQTPPTSLAEAYSTDSMRIFSRRTMADLVAVEVASADGSPELTLLAMASERCATHHNPLRTQSQHWLTKRMRPPGALPPPPPLMNTRLHQLPPLRSSDTVAAVTTPLRDDCPRSAAGEGNWSRHYQKLTSLDSTQQSYRDDAPRNLDSCVYAHIPITYTDWSLGC